MIDNCQCQFGGASKPDDEIDTNCHKISPFAVIQGGTEYVAFPDAKQPPIHVYVPEESEQSMNER